VNGIERELGPQGVQIIHLDATSGVGGQIARQYGVRGVPTLIVLDAGGKPIVTQVGRLNKEAVLEAIVQLGL
jgi:thioredoxin-related protein